jgi:hypothetical protein
MATLGFFNCVPLNFLKVNYISTIPKTLGDLKFQLSAVLYWNNESLIPFHSTYILHRYVHIYLWFSHDPKILFGQTFLFIGTLFCLTCIFEFEGEISEHKEGTVKPSWEKYTCCLLVIELLSWLKLTKKNREKVFII